MLSFDKLLSGDPSNLPTPLMLLRCYPWSRVTWQTLAVIIQIPSPCHSSFLLRFPLTFASTQNSMISVKLNAVYARHRLMMLWLMFAAYVVSSKACGSSRNSTFQELETGRTRGHWSRIADLSPNSNEWLTATVLRIQPYWPLIQMGLGKSS